MKHFAKLLQSWCCLHPKLKLDLSSNRGQKLHGGGEPLREDVNRNVQIDLWGSVLFSHLQGVDVTEGGGWFDIWLTSRVPPVCTLTDTGQYRAAEILTGSKWGESGTLNKVDVLSWAASCDDPHCSGVARGLTPRLFFFVFLVTGTLFFYLLVRSAEQHHSFAYSWKWISLISAKSHAM